MVREGSRVLYRGKAETAKKMGVGVVDRIVEGLALVDFKSLGLKAKFGLEDLYPLEDDQEEPLTQEAFEAAFIKALTEFSKDQLAQLDPAERDRHARSIGVVYGMMVKMLFPRMKDGEVI